LARWASCAALAAAAWAARSARWRSNESYPPAKRQLAALQMQDRIDHIVEQIAFMADDQQRAGIGAQEILQPQRRFKIEVVRGFVKQQHVRL
jgi:hypothetical protein